MLLSHDSLQANTDILALFKSCGIIKKCLGSSVNGITGVLIKVLSHDSILSSPVARQGMLRCGQNQGYPTAHSRP